MDNYNDLDLTDSGNFVNSNEDLIPTQMNPIYESVGNSSSNQDDIIQTGPPSFSSTSGIQDTTETNENKDNDDTIGKEINSNNDNENEMLNEDIIVFNKTPTKATTSTTSTKSTFNNEDGDNGDDINSKGTKISLFDKKIEFDKVMLFVKGDVIYKCRFLLSKISKDVNLLSDDVQRRVQKMVHVLLLKKGELIFLRDRDILVSLRLHNNNSIRNKLLVKNKYGRLIQVDKNKYSFIIQRL